MKEKVNAFRFVLRVCLLVSFQNMCTFLFYFSFFIYWSVFVNMCTHIRSYVLTIYVCMHRHAYWTGREVLYSVAFASTCNLKPELYKLKHVFVVVQFRLPLKIVCVFCMCLSCWNFGSHAATNGTSNITLNIDSCFDFFSTDFSIWNKRNTKMWNKN